ncbi:RNA polymerase sigma factor [Noviluteimonas dokdonensis]|nr:RNA polymerase sigma factor [Lysobacter dokdonensis]
MTAFAAVDAPERAAQAPRTLEAFLDGISARAFRFAEMGLRHRDDALDVVQDAMLRMLGYADKPPEEWTPLFWSVLRSRIVDAQRRNTFRLKWLRPQSANAEDPIDWSELVPTHDPESDPSRKHDNREAYSRIALAVRGLPARQREAFTLRVIEELDVATTARVMGCSEGSVKTHLFRAREALQAQLEEFA